jgi:hypothetical protein
MPWEEEMLPATDCEHALPVIENWLDSDCANTRIPCITHP